MSNNSETLDTSLGQSIQTRFTSGRSRRRPGEVRADDCLWALQMRARHGDLILRYANRRVHTPEQAERVTQAVFANAAAHRSEIFEPALPWLIAAARTECAASRARATRQPARA
jgi:DNA-directed RNA polymerase specialized sigma24 family protein